MKTSNNDHHRWETITLKAVAFSLPIFLFAVALPLHPRFSSVFGVPLGVIAHHFMPPRGRHLVLPLVIAVAGACVIAFAPGSFLGRVLMR
jgi:hypothetical protein